MSSRVRIVLITAIAAILVGWAGYRRAYVVSVRADTPGTPPITRESRVRPIEKRPDKMNELRQLLKRPANARTSNETWAIISGFSISQIKLALEQLSADGPSDAVQTQERMLYFCWAQIDPLEAMEAAGREDKIAKAKKSSNNRQLLSSAFTAWMKQDPDAACRWGLSSADIDHRWIANLMGNQLSALPMQEALEKAKAYDASVLQCLLSNLGARMAWTPADREVYLAQLASSGVGSRDVAAVLRSFIQNWGAADPVATIEGLKNLPLDPEKQQNARKQILTRWTKKDPAAVLAWMSTGENAQPLQKQVEVYNEWVENSPEEAARQFDTLSRQSPGFRDQEMKSLLTSYYQGGWIPFGRNSSSDGRYFSQLKTHYDQWTASDPGQAAAWAATLEPALQQRLQSPDRHEEH